MVKKTTKKRIARLLSISLIMMLFVSCSKNSPVVEEEDGGGNEILKGTIYDYNESIKKACEDIKSELEKITSNEIIIEDYFGEYDFESYRVTMENKIDYGMFAVLNATNHTENSFVFIDREALDEVKDSKELEFCIEKVLPKSCSKEKFFELVESTPVNTSKHYDVNGDRYKVVNVQTEDGKSGLLKVLYEKDTVFNGFDYTNTVYSKAKKIDNFNALVDERIKLLNEIDKENLTDMTDAYLTAYGQKQFQRVATSDDKEIVCSELYSLGAVDTDVLKSICTIFTYTGKTGDKASILNLSREEFNKYKLEVNVDEIYQKLDKLSKEVTVDNLKSELYMVDGNEISISVTINSKDELSVNITVTQNYTE